MSARPGAGTVAISVVAGRREVARHIVRVVDGTLEPDPEAEDADPDVVLSLGTGDAEAVRSGTLDPSVAYMRGTMKVQGDPALLLQALPLLSADPAVAFGRPED